MRTKRTGLLAAVAVLGGLLASVGAGPAARAAATINVPVDQPTIQAAIDAAAPGDTVMVAPGTYHERIDFKGKAIEVRSSSGQYWNTILDGDKGGPVVTFRSGEGQASVLRDLTITNGQGSYGGGIVVDTSSPTIVGNVIRQNVADHGGGGIGVVNGSPLIENNWIDSNKPLSANSDGAGGGIALVGGEPVVVGNRIWYNEWPAGGGVAIAAPGASFRDNGVMSNKATTYHGGGILLVGQTNVSITQNVIARNSAALGGGGLAAVALGGGLPMAVLNTIADNTAPKGSGVYAGGTQNLTLANNIVVGPVGATVVECDSPSYATFLHNDVYSGDASPISGCGTVVGTNGNISADPRFDGGLGGHDYRVKAPSPAIDAGAGLLGVGGAATDIEGKPRVVDGDGVGEADVDMGAFETPGRNEGPPSAWGWNVVNQLGDGTATDRHAPVPVAGELGNIASVAAGVYHSLALTADGNVLAWGWNGVGQLGDGTTTTRAEPVPVPGLTGVVAIAAGAYHSMALKSDGTVWTWGWNPVGQLGDGTVTDRLSPVQVPGLTQMTAVAGGAFHSLALKADGTVWSWGWNGAGQLGDNTTIDRHSPVKVLGLSDVYQIAAGYYHNIAVENGSIYLWGWNAFGQLGVRDNVDRHVPTRSNGASGMVRVAAGAYHTLALEGDGTVYAWGWNGVGQVGDNTTTDRNFPVFLGGGGVVEIAAGAFHSMLLVNDGTVKAWGWNGAGQLGDGTTVDRHVPTAVPGAAGAKAIGAGGYHSLSG